MPWIFPHSLFSSFLLFFLTFSTEPFFQHSLHHHYYSLLYHCYHYHYQPNHHRRIHQLALSSIIHFELSSRLYHTQASPSYHDQHDDFDDAMMMMPVPQHLDSEQINYEFPPKSHLKALAYLDQLEQEYSFFDETSFTSLSNDSSSSASSMSFLSGYFDEQLQDNSSATTPLRHDYISSASHLFSSLIDENDEDLDLTHIHSHHDYHMTQAQSSKEAAAASTTTTTLVDDNRLSPLQLPAQAHHYSYHHQREQSCDSTTTITKNLIVAPQSFLSMPSTAPLYKSNNNANYDNNGKRADLSALVHSSTCSVTQTESCKSPLMGTPELFIVYPPFDSFSALSFTFFLLLW